MLNLFLSKIEFQLLKFGLNSNFGYIFVEKLPITDHSTFMGLRVTTMIKGHL